MIVWSTQSRKSKKGRLTLIVSMTNYIIWNIRGMKSKGAFERLIQLVKLHKTNFVALQEPFLDGGQIDLFKNILNFDQTISNSNSKIW